MHLKTVTAHMLYTCTSQKSLPSNFTHSHHSSYSPHALNMHLSAFSAHMLLNAPHYIHGPHALHVHTTAVPSQMLYTCTPQQALPTCSTHAPHNNHSPHALHMHSTGGPAPFSIHAPHISQCPNALHMHLTAIFIIGVTQWCYHSIYYHVHCKRNSEEKRKNRRIGNLFICVSISYQSFSLVEMSLSEIPQSKYLLQLPCMFN